MINLDTTSKSSKNTTFVLLESSFVSFDGDINWSSSKCSFNLVGLLWSNICIYSEGYNTFSLFIVILASVGFFAWAIWPGGFSHEWVGFDINES